MEYAAAHESCLLHMHMGTGKTRTVYGVIEETGAQRTLIVCPKAVVRVWPIEAGKHVDWDIEVCAPTKGTTAKRMAKMKARFDLATEPLVIVVNYDSMWRSAMGKFILDAKWDLVVFDESHRIKTHNSKASKFAAKISASRKICMTGTPIPHSPLDIFSQYRVLDWRIFGKYWTQFKNRYAVMGGPDGRWIKGTKNHDELGQLMDQIRFEVRKDALTLPDIHTVDITFELDGDEVESYRSMKEEFVTLVKDEVITASNALTHFLRLQQITSGFLPRPLDDGTWGSPVRIGNSKAEQLKELLSEIDWHEDKCVVFCRFRSDIDTVIEACAEAKLRCGEVSGKQKDMDEWDRGDLDVLAVQIQAGAEGIDLTKANYMIWFSLGFSRGQYDQCLARTHRPGQKKTVFNYRLLAEGTVDEHVARALERRGEVIDEVLKGVCDEAGD